MKRSLMFFCLLLAVLQIPMPQQALQAGEPDKKFVNSLGMTFIRVPPGTFLMGSPEGEAERDSSEIPHPVRISRPFYIQTTEVTLHQWRAVMGKKILFARKGAGELPVSRVSWFDCREFIQKLNAKEDGRYRLPTEAEWEYACRAQTATAYSWGDDIDCSRAMYANSPMKFDACVAQHRTAGLPVNGPAPAGRYAPNPWGLYDMHGNLWEWVQDWYGPYTKGASTDPAGPKSGVHRVRRGGSWFGVGAACRSANRAYGHPAQRLRTTGFRLVREAQR